MKLSFFTGFSTLLSETDIDYACKRSSELGFSGVEFFFMAKAESTIPNAKVAAEYKDTLDKYSLSAPCVSVGATIVSLDAPYTLDRAIINKLLECVDFAHVIGAKAFT